MGRSHTNIVDGLGVVNIRLICPSSVELGPNLLRLVAAGFRQCYVERVEIAILSGLLLLLSILVIIIILVSLTLFYNSSCCDSCAAWHCWGL